MQELLNTLYVQTQGVSLRLDHDAVQIRVDGQNAHRVPLLRLEGIVVFGRVAVTSALIHRCAADGRSLVWLSRHGRFNARLEGEMTGNVLLRRAQHLALSDESQQAEIARQIVAAKIQNSRNQLLRSARDVRRDSDRAALVGAAEQLAASLLRLRELNVVNEIRGVEGEAAATYFDVFGNMITVRRGDFGFDGRTRRPPRDPTNAVISFLYALISAECAAALAAVGLDPQVGYLHALRPGRPALALDLVEEFRAPLADRLALTLINRQQLQAKHFESTPGGGVYLTEEGRRIVLVAYQQRKQSEIEHRVLRAKIPFGLAMHVQARLLARYLRGDLAHYPPFVYR